MIGTETATKESMEIRIGELNVEKQELIDRVAEINAIIEEIQKLIDLKK
jgi:hypothetical protein